MIRKILEHPYHVTSLVFIGIIAFGIFFLHWQDDKLVFFLLLYFIVILGIRLDDISAQIGSLKSKPLSGSEADNTVTGQLQSINSSMKIMEKTLSGILITIQNQLSATKTEHQEDETEKE